MSLAVHLRMGNICANTAAKNMRALSGCLQCCIVWWSPSRHSLGPLGKPWTAPRQGCGLHFYSTATPQFEAKCRIHRHDGPYTTLLLTQSLQAHACTCQVLSVRVFVPFSLVNFSHLGNEGFQVVICILHKQFHKKLSQKRQKGEDYLILSKIRWVLKQYLLPKTAIYNQDTNFIGEINILLQYKKCYHSTRQ